MNATAEAIEVAQSTPTPAALHVATTHLGGRWGMEPELLSLLAASGASTIAIFVSERLRSLLRAIFRRPRETSLLVTRPDGTRLELEGALDSEEIQAFIEAWLKTRQADEEPVEADGGQKPAGKDGAQSVPGGESDE
ncbi:hypothetical protein AB0D57_09845 [Streptomyces sp. NPDC048275]|uniref:hypothetical protein n=1 Tax=Streptomyces sp. NPDC048275 TaxID=3155629 RepID=UPI0033E6A94D